VCLCVCLFVSVFVSGHEGFFTVNAVNDYNFFCVCVYVYAPAWVCHVDDSWCTWPRVELLTTNPSFHPRTLYYASSMVCNCDGTRRCCVRLSLSLSLSLSLFPGSCYVCTCLCVCFLCLSVCLRVSSNMFVCVSVNDKGLHMHMPLLQY
jgi:hypothetical protein